MTKEDVRVLTENAYQAGELKNLFLGESPYAFDNLKHIPANVLSDVGAIIDQGIYEIYRSGNIAVVSMLEKAIYELLDYNSAYSIWTAYFVLRYQYRNEIKNGSPFKIVTHQLCKAVSNCINENKELLSSCKEYT